MTLKLPYLTYLDTEKEARRFLEHYWPTFELPIPIEDIIDVKIGIHIDTFPGLYKDYRLNGFLTADRTTIYIDEIQYHQFYKKCRYTLAHELGHYILHKECYENLPLKSIEEYIKWRLSISNEEVSWFETHANWFAEQVLVPKNQLKQICIKIINKYKDQFPSYIKNSNDFWSYASNEIAPLFDVNPLDVEARINRKDFTSEIQSFIE